MSILGKKLGDAFWEKLIPTIEIEQGGIYKVDDDPKNPVIKFLSDNLPNEHPKKKREFHNFRLALVIQSNKINDDNNMPSTLVVPLSHKGRNTDFTVEIRTKYLDDSVPGDTVAHVHLTQPILKILLRKKVGYLPETAEEFTTIRAVYYRLLRLI